MNATTLETLAADHRFDRQIALVRAHWAAIRNLWIRDPGPVLEDPGTQNQILEDPGIRLRSNLPGDFLLGCGLPGLARTRPIRDGRFEFSEDGEAAAIITVYDTIP